MHLIGGYVRSTCFVSLFNRYLRCEDLHGQPDGTTTAAPTDFVSIFSARHSASTPKGTTSTSSSPTMLSNAVHTSLDVELDHQAGQQVPPQPASLRPIPPRPKAFPTKALFIQRFFHPDLFSRYASSQILICAFSSNSNKAQLRWFKSVPFDQDAPRPSVVPRGFVQCGIFPRVMLSASQASYDLRHRRETRARLRQAERKGITDGKAQYLHCQTE